MAVTAYLYGHFFESLLKGDMGNMHDLLRRQASCHPQYQIVILATLEALAKPTHFAHQCGAIHSQMRNVVLGKQQIGVPLWLEVRLEALAGYIELVLVAIQ